MYLTIITVKEMYKLLKFPLVKYMYRYLQYVDSRYREQSQTTLLSTCSTFFVEVCDSNVEYVCVV